jgi:hypothetical protein
MPPKKRKGKKAPAGFPKLSLFRALLWPCIILVTGLSLFLALRLPLRAPESTRTGPQAPPVERTAPAQPPVEPTVPTTPAAPGTSQERSAPKPSEQATAQA